MDGESCEGLPFPPVRVLVLVLSFDGEPFRALESAQRRTWAATRPDGVEVLWYQGRTSGLRYQLDRALMAGAAKTIPATRARVAAQGLHNATGHLDGDVLHLGLSDVWGMINVKTVAALRWSLSRPYDVLFRTNSCSYLRLDMLVDWLSALPPQGAYAGSVFEAGGIKVASGSGFALSRDLVQEVASARSLNLGVIDDVCIASHMKAIGVQPIHRDRLDVADTATLEDLDVSKYAHIRCKNRADRSRDVENLLAVHALVGGRTGGG